MFSSSEEENYVSSENEEIHEYEEFEHFIIPKYYGLEETSSIQSIYPKWKKVPRSPSDFTYSKKSKSYSSDSEYEKWLTNYYNELNTQNGEKIEMLDKEIDTSDLSPFFLEKECKEKFVSLFPPIDTGLWLNNTKYWGPKDKRRHWCLRQGLKNYLLFPTIHPTLNLSSRYGRYHSLLNSAAAVPEQSHKNLVSNVFKKLIQNLAGDSQQLKKILICDGLCNLKWCDYMTKTLIIRNLCKFLRNQYVLEKVYFENTELRRLEGIIILCALSKRGSYMIKELHLWKMFAFGQCPLAVNNSNRSTGNPTLDFFTKAHYLQILNNFSCLTHLSVNYAYLANEDGDALLFIRSIRLGHLKELRILCLKDERPLLTNLEFGTGGFVIPDGVWKRAADLCPEMRVKFVFLNLPQYDNIIVFLSKSIPVSYIYISSGMDFAFETPWDIDSTLLEIRNWFALTLENLSLHLWHHRDLLDYVIKNKILEEFPNLLTFEFIGVLEDVESLEEFCFKLSTGIYNLKNLLFWVEEKHTSRKKENFVRNRVAEIRQKYVEKLRRIDIDADIKTYPI